MGAEETAYGAEVTGVDVAELGESLLAAVGAVVRNPQLLLQAAADFGLAEIAAAANAGKLALGGEATLPVKDRRFADRAWQENPLLYFTAATYQHAARTTREALQRTGLRGLTADKAEFGREMLLDAFAPTNVPWLNPRVLKEAYETGGRSVLRGLAAFTADLVHNGGRPQQVDRAAFELGKDLAATPGRVVYRNDLMELIAYEPQTPQVYAEPILCSPPWINKYYIMDLAPQRSFIEYAVQNGFTVFAISYRNPDSSMADLAMDDYLRDGLLAALDAVVDVTGAERVNIVALCLGGLLSMLCMAYLAGTGQANRIGWATLTNTLIDYTDPGGLRIFTDEKSIRHLERKMARRGYLEGSSMASTFDWLRGNDLVWNYVVDNWFMGKKPPAFDILAWNADSTHMPARMHSQYLRSFYLRNALVTPGGYEVLGVPLDLGKVETPLYLLAAEADHIAPWTSAYHTTQLVGGPVRFVLSNSGHIAGIVNPPGNPKAAHWVGEELPDDPQRWRSLAKRHQDSWWLDWVAWAKERSGPLVDPPELPSGPPAPGSYVRITG
jgi:polyhydroxyalkanoate synthase subunit PhaC